MTKAQPIFHRIFSNAFWYFISEIGGKVIIFLSMAYLARILNVSGFGIFIFSQTIALYLWLGVNFGINMYGIKEIAKEKKNLASIANPLLTIRIINGILFFSLFSIFISFSHYALFNKLIFIGAGFCLLTRSFNADWVLSGIEKFKYVAIGNLGGLFIFLLLIIGLVRSKDDVIAAVILWTLSFFFSGIIFNYFLKKKIGFIFKPNYSFKVWLFHLKESIHFLLSGAFLSLYQNLPVLFLGIFASSYAIGIFSAPFKLILAISTIAFALPMAFYPTLAELYAKNQIQFYKINNLFQILAFISGLLLGVFGNIFSKQIIIFLFGSQYLDSVPVFKIIIWLTMFIFIRYTFGIPIACAGLQRFYTYASALAAVSFIVFFCFFKDFLRGDFLIATSLALIIAEAILLLALMLIWELKNEKPRKSFSLLGRVSPETAC
jgi:O-antigen/teichoic acid export membrane protein